MTLEYIHPDELRKHLTNTTIYGDAVDQELLASIKANGVFEDHPIGYVQDGDFKVIVSGHRRHQCARIAKLDMVPCVRLKDIEGDPLAIEERIILSNTQRVKTNEQKAREAAKLASILEQRGGAPETTESHAAKEDKPVPIGTEKKIKDEVAEKLHTSKRTAQRLINTGKALEDAEKKGHTRRAAKIKDGLEKSVSAGEKAAKDVQPKKPNDASKKAATLLSKVTADFNRAAENLAPLVREWDDMKRADATFNRKHAALLGHHSRLFQICDDGKRVLAKLNQTWKD